MSLGQPMPASNVPQENLNRFFRRNFAPSKAAFLIAHGAWLHRGQNNQWVIEKDGEVAAYCAVIPTTMRVGGERVDAAWWVDLVVDPEHRGTGLEKVFDAKVKSTAPLIVGFPNAIAASIHRRHGWGVREDLEVRMLPLRPREISWRRAAGGFRRTGLRLAAVTAAPVARVLRRRLERFVPKCSRVLDQPGSEVLAEVFARGRDAAATTTHRDASYLAWRYLDAPYRDELFVVAGGAGSMADVAMVVRVLQGRRGTVARVLDFFGALSDAIVVRDVLWLAAKHALSIGAIQITAMSTNPSISKCLCAAGFLIRSRGRFCWTCADGGLHSRIEASTLRLVLGDSDNDEP